MSWLSAADWERAQATLPIPHVDVVVLRWRAGAAQAGLILRDTPHQGRRWNLVGGRMQHGESLGAAIRRELVAALGEEVAVTVAEDEQPHFVAQYAPAADWPFLPDPRKHAVALTYALPTAGAVRPRGEALDFRWFPLAELPARRTWGFGQDRACEACLRRVGHVPRFVEDATPPG